MGSTGHEEFERVGNAVKPWFMKVHDEEVRRNLRFFFTAILVDFTMILIDFTFLRGT